MAYTITLIPGDGVGPEVTAAVVRIVEATGVAIEWESFVAGAEALSRYGDPLPSAVLESIKHNRVALKGPLTTPVGTGFSSINVRLRKTLDLYANLRPVKTLPGVETSNAAKTGRIYRIEENQLMYFGPRTGENIEKVAALIHQK